MSTSEPEHEQRPPKGLPRGYEDFTPEQKADWEAFSAEFMADSKPVPDDHPLYRPGAHLFFVKRPTPPSE